MSVIQVIAQVNIGGTAYTPRRVEVVHSYDQPSSTFVLELGDDAAAVDLNDTVIIALGNAGDVGQVIEGGYVDSIEAVRPPGTYIVRGRDKLKLAAEYLLTPSSAGAPARSYDVPVWDNVIVNDLLISAGTPGTLSLAQVFQFTQPNNPDTGKLEFPIMSAFEAIQTVARAARARCWVRHNGTVLYAAMRPIPEDSSQNVGTLDNTNTLSLRWTKTDEGLYNKVIVMCSNGVTATATAASSPYLPSGFTKTALFDFGSDLAFTQAEADSFASARLTDLNKQRQWVDAEAIGDYRHRVEFDLNVTDSWLGLSGASFFIYSARKVYTPQGGFRSQLRLHRWIA